LELKTIKEIMKNIEVTEEDTDRKFRTETPNLIIDLVEIKALKPTEVWVYTVLKMIAGDSGCCFCSWETLASKCGLSETKVRKCIQKLQGVIPVIGGPLIRIDPQYSQDGGSLPNKITILEFDESSSLEGGYLI